ncbi:hypothetical protein MVEN_01160200 [Mycena venus]|uniref:DUF6534 domain-containing protein n=1 Tax=Mycena venus TaxID=2733690 RepID=A0A8H6Y5D6_9AGAR|nr:hypothetical protein MVEN_01160200 [Mycena venus]
MMLRSFLAVASSTHVSAPSPLHPAPDHPFLIHSPLTSLGAGALADIFTASALCFFLRKFRTENQRTLQNGNLNPHSDDLCNQYRRLHCVYQHTDRDLLQSRTFRFMAFYFIVCKFYVISFFCTLNTRQTVRGKAMDRDGGLFSRSHTSGHISKNRFHVSHVPRSESTLERAACPPVPVSKR